MAIFHYKRLNSQGFLEKKTEHLPLEVVDEAIRYLERKGAIVLSIRRIPDWLNPVAGFYVNGFARITRSDLADMFNNLSMLLGARVNALSAMNEVRLGIGNPRLLSVVNFMIADIANGQTFSQAMLRHPRVFSPVIYFMIRVGEETGKLAEMLKKLADHLSYIDHIVKETKRALIYPSMVLTVVLGAVIFWLWYVVPQVMGLFDDFGMEMPTATKLLVFMSSFIQEWLTWGLVLILSAIVIVLVLIRVFRLRYVFDWLLLKVPVVSSIIQTSIVARFSEYLAVLTGSGVTIIRALEIITESFQNSVYKRRFTEVRHEIRLGNSLAESLHKTSALDRFAVRMIAVGETTSSLDEQSRYLAEQYKQRLDNLVQNIGKILEPVLLIILGLFFALVVAGLFFPLYEVIGGLGGI